MLSVYWSNCYFIPINDIMAGHGWNCLWGISEDCSYITIWCQGGWGEAGGISAASYTFSCFWKASLGALVPFPFKAHLYAARDLKPKFGILLSQPRKVECPSMEGLEVDPPCSSMLQPPRSQSWDACFLPTSFQLLGPTCRGTPATGQHTYTRSQNWVLTCTGWARPFVSLGVGQGTALLASLWAFQTFSFDACHLSLTLVASLAVPFNFHGLGTFVGPWQRHTHPGAVSASDNFLSHKAGRQRYQFQLQASNQISRGHFTIWKLQSKQNFSLGSKCTCHLNWSSREEGVVSSSANFHDGILGKCTERK